jgi:hypothetical protein
MTKEPICKCFARVVVGMTMCALLGVPRASAQVYLGSSPWVWQNPLPQGNDLQAVTCSSAGGSLSCIAVGDLGTIIFGTAGSGGALSRPKPNIEYHSDASSSRLRSWKPQ